MLNNFLPVICMEFIFFRFLLIWCHCHVWDWCNWNIWDPIWNWHFGTPAYHESKHRSGQYGHHAAIYFSLEIVYFVSPGSFAVISMFECFDDPPGPHSLMHVKAIKDFLAPYCFLPLANTCLSIWQNRAYQD